MKTPTYLTVSLLALAAPRTAGAQSLFERFALRGEVGAGTMFPDHQRDVLGYNQWNLQGTGRLAFSLADPLAVQISAANWWYFSDQGTGRLTEYTLGLRLEPHVANVARPFLDVNAGLGVTGPLNRFALDAGIGIEFEPAKWLGVGPVFRYGHVFRQDSDQGSDAYFWSAGLSVTLRAPRAEPAPAAPPPDADGDGVPDAEDTCPREPAGAHPDPEHRGCPVRDADADGVPDGQDVCANEPAGEHPDRARPGCPLSDSDRDSVFDDADQCPTTPQGENPDPERAGCPDGDADADGVLDHRDQCRTEPAGLHADPERPGCPLPDRDHDSVPDATDHCPDQPGAPSPDPNRNGCPGLVRVENGVVQILQPVYFASNRDTIQRRSFGVLTAVADALRATPEIRRITIEGHTDDLGDDARNLQLSQRRAESVQRFLVEHGVEAGRLEAHGYGETRPVRPVTPDQSRREQRANRAANRRVDFRILDPAPAAAEAPAAAPAATGP